MCRFILDILYNGSAKFKEYRNSVFMMREKIDFLQLSKDAYSYFIIFLAIHFNLVHAQSPIMYF